MPESVHSNIHYRRRWFYVIWTGILLSVAAFWIWTEQPARVGAAKLEVVLTLRGMPSQGKAFLWVGHMDAFRNDQTIPGDWKPLRDAKVSLTSPVNMAVRRMGDAYMLRRTDDFSVVIVESSGQRRYLYYDLREDINMKLLRMGRTLRLDIETDWDSLHSVVPFLGSSKRSYIGW